MRWTEYLDAYTVRCARARDRASDLPPSYYAAKRRARLVRMLERETWSYWVMQSFKPRYQPGKPREMLTWYMDCMRHAASGGLQRVFMATHRHKSGRVHLHGMWKVSSGAFADWRTAKEYCWGRFGKAGLYPFRRRTSAVAYALKYCFKGAESHCWDLRNYSEV